MKTPPMLSTPGSVGGIAIGSGPKKAQDADLIAKDAPMPTMKQFRMSYCSGLNSAYWQKTAARLLARIATANAATNGNPASVLMKYMAKADNMTISPCTKFTTRMMPNSSVTPNAISM